MEVPDRNDDGEQDFASAEDFEIFCQPCDNDNKRLPAAKYCQKCKEYLCKNCCERHRRVKPAQKHDLVDISDVPSDVEMSTREASETCKLHLGKIIEFYCPTHKSRVCYVCSLLDHKSCNVEYKGEIKESNVSKNPVQKTKLKQSRIGVSFLNASVSRLPDIDVKCSEDRYECVITGITFIAPNTLLIADYKNKCIKSIDISSKTVISRLPLSSEPWDITTMGESQAAVTLPKGELQIILSKGCTIKLNGCCYGVCSTEDKIIVSYYPGKIEILDHDGSVLNKIADCTGKPLLDWPKYVCVATEKDKEVLYVSDTKTHTITKLSMTGEVLWTYEDKDLIKPNGLTVTDDGHILVCGFSTRNIQVLSPDGRKVRTLLTKTEGLDYPLSLFYSSRQQALYVGCCNNGDNLRVYKLN